MTEPQINLNDEQQEVVIKLLRQGARMERQRLAETLKKFSGKLIDVDQFIVALNGIDEVPKEENA